MEEGKLRQLDAEVMARSLLGAVHHYCLTRIFADPGEAMIPEGMYVRGLVDLLLNGAVPSGETAAERRFPAPKSRSSAG
jgi:hypothetical protein